MVIANKQTPNWTRRGFSETTEMAAAQNSLFSGESLKRSQNFLNDNQIRMDKRLLR